VKNNYLEKVFNKSFIKQLKLMKKKSFYLFYFSFLKFLVTCGSKVIISFFEGGMGGAWTKIQRLVRDIM